MCLISLIKETLYLCHRNLMHLPIRMFGSVCRQKFYRKNHNATNSVAQSLLQLCLNQIVVSYIRVWEYEAMHCDILIEAQVGAI